MKVSFFENCLSLYRKVLRFFFDFDVAVYAVETTKIPINKLENYENFGDIHSQNLEIPKALITTVKNDKMPVCVHNLPSFKNILVTHNMQEEFYQMLEIKNISTIFLCISKAETVNFLDSLNITSEKMDFALAIQNASFNEINISRKLKTVEELLVLEPYTKKFPKEKALQIPVTKYPIKKEKFNDKYLDMMQTKLAIEARCKKYSMTLENIYDKFPKGLYDKVDIVKNGCVHCMLNERPELEEMQLLLVGSRKYGAKKIQCFVPYSEFGL